MTTETAAPLPMPLGARMKEYENRYRRRVPARTYTILRLDGKNFSTYTKTLDKPFDSQFSADMAQTALALCEFASGVAFAYTQSDEISLLLTDFATPTTQPWLGGVEAKMLSLSAALATAAFNAARPGHGPALFDSRLFTVDGPVEVANYFLWRQRDAIKNSISMAASARFSHRRLESLTSDDRLALLHGEAGIDWNDYPTAVRQGQVVRRVTRTRLVNVGDRRTDATVLKEVTRHGWEVADAPKLNAGAGSWLASAIPTQPEG